jgi:uracil phosphoribosyltransferase
MDEKKTDDNAATAAIMPLSPSTNTTAAAAPHGPNVHVSTHPVVAHKLSILRSSATLPHAFRAALREITFHLAYEATSTLTTRDIPITVPYTSVSSSSALDTLNGDDDVRPKGSPSTHGHVDAIGQKIRERVAIIPILRSGLGMVEPMLELVNNATVHHIGMYKIRSSQMPVQYYNRLPKVCNVDVAYILDPLIATSNTITSVVGILEKWGVPKIHVISVIASKIGLSELVKKYPTVHVTLGHIDNELSDSGDVLPGLGDAGDRLFGTAENPELDDLVHVSKRKRTMSSEFTGK